MTNYVRGGTVVEGPIGALEPMVENEPTPHQSGSVPTALGVATVLTAVSAVTTWFRVHALDTDKWVTANSELREDPEIRSALATHLVGELHSGPDVSDQPEASFADALGRHAGPLAGARRETLCTVGLAVGAGGVALLAENSVGVRIAVDATSNRSVGSVGDVFTQLLASMATTGIVISLIVAPATLLGPHRWAVDTRRRIRSTANPSLSIALGAIALVVVLACWRLGTVFERWITSLALLTLITVATVAEVSVRTPRPFHVRLGAA